MTGIKPGVSFSSTPIGQRGLCKHTASKFETSPKEDL